MLTKFWQVGRPPRKTARVTPQPPSARSPAFQRFVYPAVVTLIFVLGVLALSLIAESFAAWCFEANQPNNPPIYRKGWTP